MGNKISSDIDTQNTKLNEENDISLCQKNQHFVIHFHSIHNIPSSEISSEYRCYIKSYIGLSNSIIIARNLDTNSTVQVSMNNDLNSITKISNSVITPIRTSKSITLNCFRDFFIKPPIDSVMVIEIINVISKVSDEVLGYAMIPINDLNEDDNSSLQVYKITNMVF